MSAQPRSTISPLGADHDVERHALLDAVVALDDVVEHAVDGVGLGLGEEADTAQIHAQHRDFDVAGQFGGAQERAVAAEDENQLAAFGGALVGVDDLDFDPERAHVVGRKVHRPAVDRFRGQHPQPNAVVAEHLFHPAGNFGGLVTAGVHHQQDGAFGMSLRPSDDGPAHGLLELARPSSGLFGIARADAGSTRRCRTGRAAGWR